ncbi:MAG: hypothetical protein LH606_04495 [Cytophagaceae bacterium]|nr:hypothetical protein [Cytophagaceae bacterium]
MADILLGVPPANGPVLNAIESSDEPPNLPPPFDNDEFFIRRTLEQNPELGVELLYKRYFQPLCTHAVRFVVAVWGQQKVGRFPVGGPGLARF